jgi:hypothetical protein
MCKLDELINRDEPAWPMIQQWVRQATNAVEALPAADPDRSEALVATQVTTRSPMGAVVYETGGLLIDHGWLRVLGSGHPRLPRSLPEWNRGRTTVEGAGPAPFYLIADDMLGGFFALNGGGLDAGPGKVCYFAPDSLKWEGTELGYGDFLYWCLTGDLAKYYRDYRWPGWESEVRQLSGDQGFSIYPFLFAKGPPVGQRSRRPVPVAELYRMFVDDRS